MVKRLLRLKEIPKPVDSTDALALAICHHWRGVGNARLATAKKKAIKKR
jgi:crossover junction endodeoxyribonuclease RuvC